MSLAGDIQISLAWDEIAEVRLCLVQEVERVAVYGIRSGTMDPRLRDVIADYFTGYVWRACVLGMGRDPS